MNDGANRKDLEIALDNCASEPIHIPGRVQSFASLVAYDLETERIQYVSRNHQEWLDRDAAGLLGRPIDAARLPREVIHSTRNALGLPTIASQRERLGVFSIDGQLCDVAFHRSGPFGVWEFEPLRDPRESDSSSIAQVRRMLAGLDPRAGAIDLLDAATQVLRRVTGFDRVMGYRFLSAGEGEVAAEARAPVIQPYLGLRYPAEDIPRQVRQMMVKVPLRMIGDVRDPHSEILSHREHPLDLSLCHGRGVSPIHVEYLGNMGVVATVNLSIIVRGQLWGLFSFHHYRPRRLSPDLRGVCELFCQLFSVQLQQTIEESILRSRERATAVRDVLRQATEQTLLHAIDEHSGQMMETVQADGMAVIRGDRVDCYGDVPATAMIQGIADRSGEDIAATDRLATDGDAGEGDGTAEESLGKTAGALVIDIAPGQNQKVVFFRTEIIHQVRWGGEPQKQLEYGPNGPRLHPRASFAEYVETVTGRCEPWTEENLAAAAELRSALLESVYRDSSQRNRAWRKQQSFQDVLVAELNHRVKNILMLVRSIARQTRGNADSLESFAENFDRRIESLAVAHDLILASGSGSISIGELIRAEMAPFQDDGRAIEVIGGPVSLAAEVAPIVTLVIHELVSNAAKYGVLAGVGGELAVRWEWKNDGPDSGGLEIVWRETGVPNRAATSRRGFGFSLIERAIPYECGGKSSLDIRPDGITAKLWLPPQHVRASAPDRSERSGPSGPSEWLPPDGDQGRLTDHVGRLQRDVLLVEDNMVLAMELEQRLEAMGCAVFSVPDEKLALETVDRHPVELAVLDIELAETTSFKIARQLARRGIPFLFLSGYHDRDPMPEDLQDFPRLAKPVDGELLRQTIAELTPGNRNEAEH